jgi:hypothetical protein
VNAGSDIDRDAIIQELTIGDNNLVVRAVRIQLNDRFLVNRRRRQLYDAAIRLRREVIDGSNEFNCCLDWRK